MRHPLMAVVKEQLVHAQTEPCAGAQRNQQIHIARAGL